MNFTKNRSNELYMVGREALFCRPFILREGRLQTNSPFRQARGVFDLSLRCRLTANCGISYAGTPICISLDSN